MKRDQVEVLKKQIMETSNKLLVARKENVQEYRKQLISLRFFWAESMRSRQHTLWEALLSGFMDKPALIQAACIIWWDFFGDETPEKAGEHPTYLYMQKWTKTQNVEKDRVCSALVALGYPLFLAYSRVREYADHHPSFSSNLFEFLDTFNK